MLTVAMIVSLELHELTLGSAVSAAGAWRLVLRSLAAGQEAKMRTNTVIFNTAMSACGPEGWQAGAHLLRAMQRSSCRWDLISQNAALHSIAAGKLWRRSLASLHLLGAEGVTANAITHNSVAGGLGESGSWPCATGLLPRMQAKRVLPTATSYIALVAACERGDAWNMAARFFEDLQRRAVREDVIVIGAVVAAVGSRWLASLAALAATGLEINVPMLSAGLAASAKAGEWVEATAGLREARMRGMDLDVEAQGTATVAFERRGEWQLAVQSLRDMALQRLASDTVMLNAAVGACAKAQEWEQTLSLLASFAAFSLPADVVAFGAATSACEGCSAWRSALAVLQKLDSEGQEMNLISYNAALSACAKGGEWRIALTLFFSIETRGLSANVITINSAIAACTRAGDWRRVLALFIGMGAHAVHADETTYQSVTRALLAAGRFRAAAQVLEASKTPLGKVPGFR
eukprot:s3327_g2.t2